MTDPRSAPKVIGTDTEMGNFIRGLERPGGTGPEAARALLRTIDGVPNRGRFAPPPAYVLPYYDEAAASHASWSGSVGYDPQDWGRKFLATNGGCAYIDLHHLELASPEVRSAFDFVASWHAMLRIARGALDAANTQLPEGQRLQVLVNNSDGRSHSYGGHVNFLLARDTWEAIFSRRLHYLVFLASFQASSIVITGQGKVGSENGAPAVNYQIAQRADFFETLMGEQTTERRPIVNSRDEDLCGTLPNLARLHCIFFDSTLCHVATALKVGLMQIVLSMIEAGRVRLDLLLDDPVAAVRCWSHDPNLRAGAPLLSGNMVTAVELQQWFFDDAQRFVAAGGCTDIVPHAAAIIELWGDTLDKLAQGNLAALAPRLDWVLKRQLLERVLEQRPHLTWSSPAIKHLDHLYSSLDEAEGLYWTCDRNGLVERLVDDARVEHFVHNPPNDTRAWTRAKLLACVPAEAVESVDWDAVTVRLRGPGGAAVWRVDLSNPIAGGEAEAAAHFAAADDLRDLLRRLGARIVPPQAATGTPSGRVIHGLPIPVRIDRNHYQ